MRIVPLEIGRLDGDGAFITGEEGWIKLPIPSWLILHPAGVVLFDTGLHAELQHDVSRLGSSAAVFKPDFAPGEELIDLGVYNPDDFDLGHDVELVTGSHDVFGDGKVVCLPTPGHTPGHQALRVELESGPVVLTGDCVYFADWLDQMRLPVFGHDTGLQLESIAELRRLRDEDGCYCTTTTLARVAWHQTLVASATLRSEGTQRWMYDEL